MKTSLIVSIFLLLGFLSCKVACKNPGLGLKFTGFDSSELTGVAITQMIKGNLQKPISVTICSSTLSSGGDTLKIYNKAPYGFYALFSFDPNYDYTVQVLPSGPIHKITGIAVSQESSYDTDHNCFDPESWDVDGTHHSVRMFIEGVQSGPEEEYDVVVAK